MTGISNLGLGWAKNEKLLKTLSRSGDRRELLRGPTIYGLVFVLCTLLFWRHDPTSIVALMILCGGDGLADVFGRSFGDSYRFRNTKSLIGSIAMFLGGCLFSISYLFYFESLGNFSPSFSTMANIPRVLLINL